jgi:hypothetical protein
MTDASKEPDVEIGHLRDGYPSLATWAARDPDNETFIFRRFDRLSARNILHQQAHIVALELEIDAQDEEARYGDDETAKESSSRWETLMEHSGNHQRSEKQRVEKLDELKDRLHDYCRCDVDHMCLRVLTRTDEALVLRSQVAVLPKPRERPLSAFRHYLRGSAFLDDEGDPIPLIHGRAREFLEQKSDLVTLTTQTEGDYLSRFLQDHWHFRKRKSPDPLDCTTIHKNSHVVRTVAALDMILAAMLLIGAIVNLYLVPNPKAKLGLVAMYTMLFASSMALCTNARRAEVFAATAAYAAVLVVFVSGDLGGTKSEQCLIQLEGGILKTVRCPD